MRYKKGDRFIVEIEQVTQKKCYSEFNEPTTTDIYHIKGFNSLVFDGYGLDRLTQIPENAEIVTLEKVMEAPDAPDEPKLTSEKKNVIVLQNDPYALTFLIALDHNGFKTEVQESSLGDDEFLLIKWEYKK